MGRQFYTLKKIKFEAIVLLEIYNTKLFANMKKHEFSLQYCYITKSNLDINQMVVEKNQLIMIYLCGIRTIL